MQPILTISLSSGTSFDLQLVEGGAFDMGGSDPEARSNEKPVHRMQVSGFYIGKHTVTQRLWEDVMEGNPSIFKGEKRPVENISWDEAQAFLEKLNARQDVEDFLRDLDPPCSKFRLPTEAEWEYAARGGRYSQDYLYAGSDKLKQVGWYGEGSSGQTHEVGLLLPNELGICDMSGNVWEWCEDHWHDSYKGAPTDGSAWVDVSAEKGAYRLSRGGSYFYDPLPCRPASRRRRSPGFRFGSLGFRLALPFQSVG